MEQPCTIVVPFFRASVYLDVNQRPLFDKNLPHEDFEAMLGRCSVPLRQNVSRIFSAALIASQMEASLVFVEGWRSNVISRPGCSALRWLTGSQMAGLLLQMLKRRGLVDSQLRALRLNHSRCTWEEAQSVSEIRLPECDEYRYVGVTEFPCPSAGRANRYLSLMTNARHEVFTPIQAIRQWNISLDEAQQGLLNATRLRWPEFLFGFVQELANWKLHGISEFEQWFSHRSEPLECRLAQRLRKDKG